jgi:hypothetical protein
MQDISPTTLLLVIVAIVAIALAAWAYSRTERRKALARKYGPEFERVAREKGDPDRAVRELEAREKRVGTFHLRELPADERDRHRKAWRRIQATFVDEPARAVREAHTLLMAVMRDRGYPEADLAQRQRDLSVSHPELIEPYREASALAARPGGPDGASTEDLRRATICYRSLLEALLEGPPTTSGGLPRKRREVA